MIWVAIIARICTIVTGQGEPLVTIVCLFNQYCRSKNQKKHDQHILCLFTFKPRLTMYSLVGVSSKYCLCNWAKQCSPIETWPVQMYLDTSSVSSIWTVALVTNGLPCTETTLTGKIFVKHINSGHPSVRLPIQQPVHSKFHNRKLPPSLWQNYRITHISLITIYKWSIAMSFVWYFLGWLLQNIPKGKTIESPSGISTVDWSS